MGRFDVEHGFEFGVLDMCLNTSSFAYCKEKNSAQGPARSYLGGFFFSCLSEASWISQRFGSHLRVQFCIKALPVDGYWGYDTWAVLMLNRGLSLSLLYVLGCNLINCEL